MERILMICIVMLLLTSCSFNNNVDIGKLNPATRFNKNETVDNIGRGTNEHIHMEQDYQEVNGNKSNVIEYQSSNLEITKENDSIIDSTKTAKELGQIIKQPFIPPNKQEKVIDEQIEFDSSPPVTTQPPVETTPTSAEQSKELTQEPLCPNAWSDENQPCDWIHPNLKPTDELGRTVPIFSKSEEAWNWAEKQMFDETSIWYMCGFNLMDGHTNDGTTFYYGYMKACP